MTIRLRTAFFILLGILFIWFLFIERGILRPFIIAGIFAYIFNPTVNFFSQKIKLPRVVSVIIIYAALIAFFIWISVLLTERISAESDDIRNYVNTLLRTANSQINGLPEWAKPTIYDALNSLRKSRFFTNMSIVPFFPKAISGIIGFLIFFFSGFYFLKDGDKSIDRIIKFSPREFRKDVGLLLGQINQVLGGYLRGQLFLIAIVAMMLFIALTIIGVRFSLVIAIFSGFAEIIPVVGPIVAGAVAVLTVLLTGTANFGLTPVNAALFVVIIYFCLRYFEDYFIAPHVLGKITKLPPFIIFFAVIAGGHIWGILGLILAVPVTAIIKILLDYCFHHINNKNPGSE